MLNKKITGQMSERKRDALEAAWLGQLSRIPGATATQLDTADDLYNYLLIDTRSGWEQTTSVVAQVIASLQQYINNILFGSEPGYGHVSWQQEHKILLEAWQAIDSQYDTWAANVMLAQYPENYLAPPLRIDQTGDFAQMVNDLNQGPLNDDTILAAVQGYLNRFEEVANLGVVSSYVAGTDLQQDDYYFLGCTASKPHTYYWRKCAMHLNTVTTMIPNSWTEWLKIDLPLGADNIVGLPRPVIQNNRLYIVWFERRRTDTRDSKTAQTVNPTITLTAQMAYLKFDDTWSVPQLLGSASGNATDDGDGLYSSNAIFSTLALEYTDASGNPFLYTGLYSAADAQCPTTGIANDKAMVCALDAWMNPAIPDADAMNTLFIQYAAQILAIKNNNASVVNPTTTSQQFLQRAIAVTNSVLGQITNNAIAADDLFVGSLMPSLSISPGQTAQPNTIVINSSDIKKSELILDFTPGELTIPLNNNYYGDGYVDYKPDNDGNNGIKLPLSVRFYVNKNEEEPTMTLLIRFQTADAYQTFTDSDFNNIRLIFKDKHQNISYGINLDDEKYEISAQFVPEDIAKLVDINFFTQTELFAQSNIPKDIVITPLPAEECIIQIAITNGEKILQAIDFNGLTLHANDHCVANLSSLDFSINSYFSFDFSIVINVWDTTKKILFGRTIRHAFTTIRLAKSLNPVTDPLPVLDTYTDPVRGTVEFVHFDFKADEKKSAAFAPENIRLNTLFAKELVKSAQNGLEYLFQWNTQLTPEPNIGPGCWLSLILPKYNPDIHGKSRVCTIIMYPKDGLHYPLSESNLDDQPKLVHVFLPFNSILVLDEKDSQGITYQIVRVFLETMKTSFTGNNDEVVVAFEKENKSITPQVINDAPWGGFKRYSGFDSAVAQPGVTTPMDFSYANGLYFWELFYHTPVMVAYVLNSRGQYADARRWQQRVFDPAAINQGTDRQGNLISNYWKVVPVSPLYAKDDPSYAIEGPTDPDALAYADPEHFRKASYMSYVQTQIALGDSFYRQLTPDSLNQAMQIYTQTRVLLGVRPDDGLVSPWMPVSLKEAANLVPRGMQIAHFEQQLTTLPQSWVSYPTDNSYPSLQAAPSGMFYPPVNRQLLMLWDILAARRHNLRHNLDINGNPLNLPLFASPLNPLTLLASEVQSGTVNNLGGGGIMTIPPCRYIVMSEKARDAAGLLSEFGQKLLQTLEAKDERHKEVVEQGQLADLWVFIQHVQQQAVDIANNSLDTLNTSLNAAQQRHDYYQGLIDSGRSSLESNALSTLAASSALIGAVAVPSIAAGVVALTPNIFGLADGGSDWAGPLKGIAEGSMSLGFAGSIAANAISIQAEFERRQADWQQQVNQASHDITTLNSQIIGQKLQINAAKTAQALAVAQNQQVMAMYTFLSSRFTNEALYQWLSGQLSALYYQAYDAALSLCLSAQTCWQYELGDFITTFIPVGGWNSQYRGLLAGETLRLSLLQMDNAWLMRNSRSLNIIRSFSLREKLGEQAWSAFLSDLKTGPATFSFNEKDFDLDYPGHYLRQIASVSVSLPALIGPYQNVRATLTQTGNSLVIKPDIEAIKYLKDNNSGSVANIKRNINSSQEIALSAGIDDNGTFILNPNDARYQPFEGTGAVSDWVLSFPNPSSKAQQQVLSSLNDIVVTIRYTASNGGNNFADQVLKLWTTSS